MSFCRITKEKIPEIMSFGSMPLANGFLKKNQFKNEYFFDLKVAFNKKLSLFQLTKNPNPKKMFNKKTILPNNYTQIKPQLLMK